MVVPRMAIQETETRMMADQDMAVSSFILFQCDDRDICFAFCYAM